MYKILPHRFELTLSKDNKKDILWCFSFILINLLLKTLNSSETKNSRVLIDTTFVGSLVLLAYRMKKSFDEQPTIKLMQDKKMDHSKFIYIHVNNKESVNEFYYNKNIKPLLIKLSKENSYEISFNSHFSNIKNISNVYLILRMKSNNDKTFSYDAYTFQNVFNK